MKRGVFIKKRIVSILILSLYIGEIILGFEIQPKIKYAQTNTEEIIEEDEDEVILNKLKNKKKDNNNSISDFLNKLGK